MPHPKYTLPRDAAAIIARSSAAAKHLATWYGSGNPGEALSALRRACTTLLANGHELEPEERSSIALVLADIEPLR